MPEEKKTFKDSAKYRANNKYIKENYKQVKLSMPNEEADILRAYCDGQGLSVAGLIRDLLKEKIGMELSFDHKEADYLLRATYPDGKAEILGKFSDKDEAMEEGKRIFSTAEKGTTISCIKATVDADGKIEGKYLLYNTWS